jgi:hypothetical protein
LSKYDFLIKRKALKKFKPLSIDVTESEELKAILNEIDVLQKLTSKSEYVINYLDTFITFLGDDNEYKVYHIVTNIYEVIFLNFFIS